MSKVVNMRERIVQGFMAEALQMMRAGQLEGVALVILPEGEPDALHVHILPDDAARRRVFRDGVMALLTAAHGHGRTNETGSCRDGQD